MSDITHAVISMPFDLAMSSELSRRQFHSRAQAMQADYDTLRAEVERLRALADRQEQQIATLTADPNGWQAGYNKGRHDGTKTRLSELEQERRINRELSALLGKEGA